jgi:hypothetical protein
LTFGIVNAQSTLNLYFKDCRQDKVTDFITKFNLFKNDSLIKTFIPKDGSQQIIEGLQYGSYKIEYESVFRKTESINIELKENRKYYVDLCYDYINYDLETYIPFIDQLKDKESYSIQISSQGCFNFSNDLLIIKRTTNNYFISYEGGERLLSKEDIDIIRHFEIELNYMSLSGCTTVDDYILVYNNKEVKISDGSCRWFGGGNLKLNLHLTKE